MPGRAVARLWPLAATGVCGARRSPATASLPDAPGTGQSCGRAGCAAPGELLGLPALELPALALGAVRKSVVFGTRVSVRVECSVRRILTKTTALVVEHHTTRNDS